MRILWVLLVFGAVALSVGASEDVSGAFKGTSRTVTVSQVNEYSNYVHFQPGWNSYPKNLIVDVTTSWKRQMVQGEHGDSSHEIKHRQNTLQYVNGRPVVTVQYDYRDCEYQWFHYAKTGLDFLGNHLRLFEAKSIPNTAYSDQEQERKLKNGFAQFVPICTSLESTSYEYVVEINDSTIGFDVYFVPSYIQQWNYFFYPDQFEYYIQDGCHARNYQKFTGMCSTAHGGGLLIVIPDELSRPLTEISVRLTEK